MFYINGYIKEKMHPIRLTDNNTICHTKCGYKKYCNEDFKKNISGKTIDSQKCTSIFFQDLAKQTGLEIPQIEIDHLAGRYILAKKPVPLSLIVKTAQYLQDGKKQILDNDLYFIKMKKYDKMQEWAHSMNGLTYILSYMVSSKQNLMDIMRFASYQLSTINEYHPYFGKERNRNHTFTIYKDENNRGREYYERYKDICTQHANIFTPASNEKYKDAEVCSIVYNTLTQSTTIIHEKPVDRQKNLMLASEEYNTLQSDNNPSIDDINRTCATIQWLITQQMPFIRGNDSFANLITKAIYHAYDVKISPAKKGYSFDFEAFCTNLDDYIKIYPDLFEKKPCKLD